MVHHKSHDKDHVSASSIDPQVTHLRLETLELGLLLCLVLLDLLCCFGASVLQLLDAI